MRRRDGNPQPAEVGRTSAVRRLLRRLTRSVTGVRRRPDPAGGGSRLRSAREVLTARRSRRFGVAMLVLAVTLGGVLAGVLLGGRVQTDVGPFRAEMALTPSLSGGTTVSIPPLGALQLRSHSGPAHLSVQLGSLDQRRTEALIDDPATIAQASRTAVSDVSNGIVRLGLRTVGGAVLATLLLAGLVFRDVRRVAWCGTLALVVTIGSLGVAGLTIRPQSIEEPRYEGLLVNAPAVVGDARRIATDYNRYAEQLQRMLGNVSQLYTTVSTLPIYEQGQGGIRVLHVSDMHLNPTGWQVIRTVVEQFNIDVVIDTGDMTDWGSEPEASFTGSIGLLKVPYVFIRGNHDSPATAAAVARQRNAIVLDNQVVTAGGLTIAGIGDPRFTPDKETSPNGSGASPQTLGQLVGVGDRLASTIRSAGRPVDVALVHDPGSSGPLTGVCPLVLAGHTHNRAVSTLPQPPGMQTTRLMVQGSTGGAGLRGLEGETPTPLLMSVLYFDQQRALQAYDDIRVGGTGEAQVSLQRHLIKEVKPAAPAAAGSASPTPTTPRSPVPTS